MYQTQIYIFFTLLTEPSSWPHSQPFLSCYFLFLKPIIILSTIHICSLIMICCWQCSFLCTFFSFHVYVHIHVGGYCVYAGEFAHVCAFMWRSKADLGFFLINLPQYSLSQCLSVKSKTWWYTYKLVQRISYFCFLMNLELQEAELEFNCVWRSKPWSLCLQDKHFNNWAISLTNLQFLSGISCPIPLDLLRWPC